MFAPRHYDDAEFEAADRNTKRFASGDQSLSDVVGGGSTSSGWPGDLWGGGPGSGGGSLTSAFGGLDDAWFGGGGAGAAADQLPMFAGMF